MLLFRGGAKNVAAWMRIYVGAYGGDHSDCNAGGAEVGKRRVKKLAGVLATDETLALLDAGVAGFKALSLGPDGDAGAAARVFYGALRTFDEMGVTYILCEAPAFNKNGARPEREGVGAALADRMARAAGSEVIDADNPSVLFICAGNTCRSAMAEALFNARRVRRLRPAASAGLYAYDGAPATRESVEEMRLREVDLTAHRARALDHRLVSGAALALTMTRAQRDEVISRFPASAPRVFTLAGFIAAFTRGVGGDIEDPYNSGPGAYNECAGIISGMMSKLTDILAAAGSD